MQIGEFTLVNHEKVDRAINGNIGAEGKLTGGVGEGASDELKLAEYDRLGGLVRKGKYNIKTGSFYDFEKQQPRKDAEVVFVMKDLNGETVEVTDGEPIPMEVRAAEVQAEKKANKAKKVKKAKKTIEDEDDE